MSFLRADGSHAAGATVTDVAVLRQRAIAGSLSAAAAAAARAAKEQKDEKKEEEAAAAAGEPRLPGSSDADAEWESLTLTTFLGRLMEVGIAVDSMIESETKERSDTMAIYRGQFDWVLKNLTVATLRRIERDGLSVFDQSIITQAGAQCICTEMGDSIQQAANKLELFLNGLPAPRPLPDVIDAAILHRVRIRLLSMHHPFQVKPDWSSLDPPPSTAPQAVLLRTIREQKATAEYERLRIEDPLKAEKLLREYNLQRPRSYFYESEVRADEKIDNPCLSFVYSLSTDDFVNLCRHRLPRVHRRAQEERGLSESVRALLVKFVRTVAWFLFQTEYVKWVDGKLGDPHVPVDESEPLPMGRAVYAAAVHSLRSYLATRVRYRATNTDANAMEQIVYRILAPAGSREHFIREEPEMDTAQFYSCMSTTISWLCKDADLAGALGHMHMTLTKCQLQTIVEAKHNKEEWFVDLYMFGRMVKLVLEQDGIRLLDSYCWLGADLYVWRQRCLYETHVPRVVVYNGRVLITFKGTVYKCLSLLHAAIFWVYIVREENKRMEQNGGLGMATHTIAILFPVD